MKKNRMVAGIVLTTGLGLTGVMAASPSGAATQESARTTASTSSSTSISASAVAIGGSTGKGGGPTFICVIQGKVLPGKPVPGQPGKPLPGKLLPGKPVPGKPGKPGTVVKGDGKVLVKIVNGKVYINGKLVPGGKLRHCPPVPPLPPVPGKGKGVVCIIEKGPVKPGQKAGKSTVKVVNGKLYINGKLVPKGDIAKRCPLPPFPGKGHGKGGGVVVIEPGPGNGKGGGVVVKPGTIASKGGASVVAGLTTALAG